MKKGFFSVQRKLIAGFFAILLLAGILGGESLRAIFKINEKTNEITESWLPGVETINKLSFLMERIISLEYQYIMEEHKEDLNGIEESMAATFSEIAKTLASYEETIYLEEDQKNYDEVLKEWKSYQAIHEEILRLGGGVLLSAGTGRQDAEATSKIIDEGREKSEQLQKELNDLLILNHDGAAKAGKEGNEVVNSAITENVVLLIVIVLLVSAIAFILGRIIVKPLEFVTDNLKQAADGDLTMDPLNVKNKDEIGVLAHSFNIMGTNLANLIREIRSSSQQVASASDELLGNSEQTSSATEQITVSIQEVALGAEKQVEYSSEANNAAAEISRGMGEVDRSIHSAVNLGMKAAEMASSGNETAQDTVIQIAQVNDQVERMALIVNHLGDRSKEIGNIVDVISQISAQTNLLALNAAIEAARAGEHGKGFAVVADEVRKLAEQSTSATDSIRDIIVQIQSEIKNVIESMQEGRQTVQAGILKVKETGKAFTDIAGMINSISLQMKEVATVVEEVNTGADNMVSVMSDIAAISRQAAVNTQQVAASAEEQNASMQEVAASVHTLSSLAAQLQNEIRKFKV